LYELDKLRKEIDLCDKDLVEIFEKRMDLVKKVANYKNNNSMDVLNKDREKEVIDKNLEYLDNINFKNNLEDFFENVMRISREIQNKEVQSNKKIPNNILADDLCVGYQGVSGSFSEKALLDYFGKKTIFFNFDDFEDVFKAIDSGKINYGILPIENTSTGGIDIIYDLLRKYNFYIVGEQKIKINHNLLGTKGTKFKDIKEVYSHPQGFMQCSEFLDKNWKLIFSRNTAVSAKYIKEQNDKTKVAIASKKAAKLYGLDVLFSNINDNNNNYTRFIIVADNLKISDKCNKISIVFTVDHKPGSLFNVIKEFNNNKLNILKIQSRPILNKPWEYFFYLDFEGNTKEKISKEVLELIKKRCIYFKLLGNYKSQE